MPFLYYNHINFIGAATSATPNTELDSLTMRPGARDLRVMQVTGGGTGAALVAISGIAFRLKRFTSSASAQSFPNQGVVRDPGTQVARASLGLVSSQGTGGPVFLGGFSCSSGGPGGWRAKDVSSGMALEGSANQSIDTFTVSATASMLHIFTVDFVE